MKHFGRVITAMVTPFDNELNVDYQKARELAAYLADSGSEGIVVAGTTGEAPVLSKEEKLKLFQVVKEEVGDKVKVIAGTGTNNTKESISLSKEAEAIGADGIMLVVPYYNKPSQEGLYQHFAAIASEVRLPIMLYNVPGRTVTNMSPLTVARLAKIENVVALKEASASMDQLSEIKSFVSDQFFIYSGDDSLTLPMLSLGGVGVVSVASHLVGLEIQQMISCFANGDHDKALEIHLQLLPFFKVLFITSNPVPLKFALNSIGIDVGGVRLPLVQPDLSEQEQILQVIKQVKPQSTD
jgi:4-hydroxy-tetrahydrodipicolinate synthase